MGCPGDAGQPVFNRKGGCLKRCTFVDGRDWGKMVSEKVLFADFGYV